MLTPTEHKTVQAWILAFAEVIGWTFVSQKDAERRRGKTKGGQECPPSLFFGDLLATGCPLISEQSVQEMN